MIDWEALRVSGFAWAHRRKIGRVRAYVRTVWQVTWGGAMLTREAAKMQDPADARSFRRVTAVLVAASLVGAFVAGILAAGGPRAMAIRFGAEAGPLGWLDLLMPWAQGVLLWPAWRLVWCSGRSI
jgi:hypothetical protein